MIDPKLVWTVLVTSGATPDHPTQRNWFISGWQGDWDEWKFEGNLGFGGKIWREQAFVSGEGYVPTMRLSCYSEDNSPERTKIIALAETKLTDILYNSGVRRRPA
jgi:hypothetical protein